MFSDLTAKLLINATALDSKVEVPDAPLVCTAYRSNAGVLVWFFV